MFFSSKQTCLFLLGCFSLSLSLSLSLSYYPNKASTLIKRKQKDDENRGEEKTEIAKGKI